MDSLDIVVDSSDNKYFFYEVNGNSDNNVRATKIDTDGNYTWSKLYTNITSKRFTKSVVLSSDESKIRMLTQTSGGSPQLTQISTSNLDL